MRYSWIHSLILPLTSCYSAAYLPQASYFYRVTNSCILPRTFLVSAMEIPHPGKTQAFGSPSLSFIVLTVKLAQSCPTFCDPHGLQPTMLLRPWDSPGKNTGVGCHFLLQAIFPTQGSNPGLPRCRQTLYHLSHQGSPSKAVHTYKAVPLFLKGAVLHTLL